MAWANFATEHVALWAANDGEHYDRLRAAAEDSPIALAGVAIQIIRSAPRGAAAWHVAQSLAADDHRTIDWAQVADELTVE
jgi:hypothetical protein